MELRIIQNVETVDLINFINRKKKLHQRKLLEELEKYMAVDSEEYKAFRKAILDNTSDFSRSVVRTIFGDTFEGYIK